MKKFEIKKSNVEVAFKERNTIKKGITINCECQEPEHINTYDSLEDAKNALKNLKTSIKELTGGAGIYYLVEEYYIEQCAYDEDGDIKESEIIEISDMVIELVKKPSYDTLAVFDNMEDAEKAYSDYDGDDEVYISF